MKLYLNASRESFLQPLSGSIEETFKQEESAQLLDEQGIKEKENELKKRRKIVNPRRAASILLEESTLKDSKFYPQFDAYYVYDEEQHIYINFNKGSFLIIVTEILSLVKYEPLTKVAYVRKVVDNLSTFPSHACIGLPEVADKILVFNNCLFNLDTKSTEPYDPEHLVVSKLPFDYVEGSNMSHFDQYLNDLTEGYTDRKEFIRAFLYVILFGPGKLQLFFHIYGLSSSGKSTLANICQCLIGKVLCVTSSLKRLSGDPFEVANLANKKLILISENENWTTETSILKMISGGDPLPGRIKHLQGSFEVNLIGTLAIFNNYKFEVRDETNAISRRIKMFKADNSVPVKKDLLRFSPRTGWEGLLVKEMCAILRWVVEMDRDQVDFLLENMETSVPSLAEEVTNSKLSFNPLYRWVIEEIVPGQGAYFGVMTDKTIKNKNENKDRRISYFIL